MTISPGDSEIPDAGRIVRPDAAPDVAPPTMQSQQIAAQDDRLPGRPLQWLGLMIAAAAVGAAVGLVGGGFRMALERAGHARAAMLVWAHLHAASWIGWAIPTGLCALGAGIGSWLTQRLAPQSAGSGIPRIEAVLRDRLPPAGALILPVKFVGGTLSIGSGLALGREGPTVQMGGTIGRVAGDWLGKYLSEPWTLMAAGAGAGLAAAFNAPLAATLFVVEELLHRFSARIFSATLMACITGTLVLRMMLGDLPDFGTPRLGALPADVLPEYALLGALAGFLGYAFNVCLLAALRLFERAALWPKGAKGALVGAAAGLIAWFAPAAVGGGENLAQFAITGHALLPVIVGLLALRYLLTLASYGCGAPGGIFAPLLSLGALLGNAFALVNAHIRHAPFDPSPFAIVAMAALFTAVVRSPLTGVVLLLEMTGDWTLILPMMAASVTAYAVPELLGNPPIYDSLRKRDERVEQARRQSGG